MPDFVYTAMDRQGNTVQGTVEANDVASAAATLRGRALFVRQLKARGGGSAPTPAPATPATSARAAAATRIETKSRLVLHSLGTNDLVFFFRQLALMLRTGLSLLQALEVCRGQARVKWQARVYSRLMEDIQNGSGLSQAMLRQPGMFPDVAPQLIASAEASGELDMVLDRVATYLEQRAQLKATLITSLTYPCIVIFAASGTAIFLTWVVIPKFVKFFEQRSMKLPWATQLLMDFSFFFQRFGPLMVALFFTTLLGVFVMYQTKRGRYWIDRALLSTPVIKGLLTFAGMAQMSRTLGMLLSSGLPLLDCLRITAAATTNRVFSGIIENAGDRILGGNAFSPSLRHKLIPPLVTEMVHVGERTGALTEILSQLGDFFERELQVRIKRMNTWIEPITTLAIGTMVGFVYFAFFQALFQIAAGVKK